MLQYRAQCGVLTLGVLAAFALSARVQAQTPVTGGALSLSPTAPATDSNDVFNALFGEGPNGSTDYSDNGTPGQRFTTGSDPLQGLLSITVKGNGFGSDYNKSGGLGAPRFAFRISTISGNTLTPIFAQEASSSGLPDGGTTGYLKFLFSNPVALQPNTQYSFDLYSTNGYLPLAKSAAVGGPGTGGSFNTGSNRNFNSTTANNNTGFDRTFFATIEVPEPGTMALCLVGLVGSVSSTARRLRRRK